MKSCGNCGCTVENDELSFCPVCGAPLQPGPLPEDTGMVSASRRHLAEGFAPFLPKSFRPVLVLSCFLAGAGLLILLLNAAAKDPFADPPIAPLSGDFSSPALAEALEEIVPDYDFSFGSHTNAPAVASDTQVVLRNAAAEAVITVDGNPVEFSYAGNDAVLSRELLPDVCVVRIIAPTDDGWETAAVWYDAQNGNDLTLGDENGYGAYVPCDESGKAEPSFSFLQQLTRIYYLSFLQSINEQDSSLLRYTTQQNLSRQEESIYGPSNAKNLYDPENFTADCEPSTVLYQDGQVVYNASFVCYPTNRTTGSTKMISNHRTIRLVWESGMWKVDLAAFLSNADFAAGHYADD